MFSSEGWSSERSEEWFRSVVVMEGKGGNFGENRCQLERRVYQITTIMSSSALSKKKHTAFLVRCLRGMPQEAVSLDAQRMTLAYFLIASLDLLGTLWSATKENERAEWIEWVWEQQLPKGGFRGSSFTGPLPTSYDADVEPSPTTCSTQANLASTYTALLLLALLRAPLNRLNRQGLVAFVKQCQLVDGSFSPLRREMQAEHDVRMVLCACVISDLLNDWDGVDVDKARAFVERCKTYEGGYSQQPGQEAQGGTTYCAIASLFLLSKAPSTSSSSSSSPSPFAASSPLHRDTVSWLLHRQLPVRLAPSPYATSKDDPSIEMGGGFQGRTGKKGDSCYSFWCGGALSILGSTSLVAARSNGAFLLRCQSPIGGFAKGPGTRPDPFHTYASISALALLRGAEGEEDLELGTMDAARNVGGDAVAWFVKERERLFPQPVSR